MPCCKAFEPDVQSGHLKASLGFSVRAEPAHQSLRRLPFNECWDKDHLPITHTAGARTMLKQNDNKNVFGDLNNWVVEVLFRIDAILGAAIKRLDEFWLSIKRRHNVDRYWHCASNK